MKLNIRILYLYLFAAVGLIITVISGISLVNLGLKTMIFKDVDKYEIYVEKDNPITAEEQEKRQSREQSRQKQRELSQAISMIVVGLPLYLYHWNTIKKYKEN